MSGKINEKLDNLGKKINSVAVTAKDKTVKLAKATQIRIDIKGAEARLELVYEDLGKAYYASLKGEEYTGEALEDLVARAESIKEKIKALKESLKSYSDSE